MEYPKVIVLVKKQYPLSGCVHVSNEYKIDLIDWNILCLYHTTIRIMHAIINVLR